MEPPSLVISHFEGIEKTKHTMSLKHFCDTPIVYGAMRVWISTQNIDYQRYGFRVIKKLVKNLSVELELYIKVLFEPKNRNFYKTYQKSLLNL